MSTTTDADFKAWPPGLIAELKARLGLVELIGRRVALKKRGREHVGLCPFHKEKTPSFTISEAKGFFHCFGCGANGDAINFEMRSSNIPFVEAVERLAEQADVEISRSASGDVSPSDRKSAAGARSEREPGRQLARIVRLDPPPEPVRDDLPALLQGYQAALPGSLGERYLAYRRVPLDLAQAHGLGYAAPGTWPNPKRDWKRGRLVVPHTDPAGRLISFYGRAVGADDHVHKLDRHDHLPGNKAYFNATVLREGAGAVFVVEGPFDALAFMAAGVSRTVAIFGKSGWRWDWPRDDAELVIAFDADADAAKQARELAREAVLRGRRVSILPPEAYGGHKDVAAAWAAGVLAINGEPWALVAEDRQAEWAERAALRQC